MIQVNQLTKYFGPVLAVDRVSFEVDRGEIVGFLGPNGAGKTTTMRMLTSYLPASSGSARVAGFDVATQSLDVRRNIGFLPESVPLYGEMRVEEYVMFRAKLKGVPRKGRAQRVDYCLERCRLKEVRRRLLHTLSKGYRQRVGLADAMVHEPAIMILDEPTSGLDPLQIRETLALIRELGEKHTILLSTHILPEVEAICQRVIVIARGRVGLSSKLTELGTVNSVLVEIRGEPEAIGPVLQAVAGVARFQHQDLSDGWHGYVVESAPQVDVREALVQAVVGNGLALRRLELRRQKLEDAFLDVVRSQDPLAETTAAR
jgi:ABC-2 type transport system ATP-binding protein